MIEIHLQLRFTIQLQRQISLLASPELAPPTFLAYFVMPNKHCCPVPGLRGAGEVVEGEGDLPGHRGEAAQGLWGSWGSSLQSYCQETS